MFPALVRRVVSLILLAAFLACGGEAPAPERDASSERELPSGAVVGYAHADHEAHAWKGIPFAAPPVGPLRWRAPRPPEAWEGTREALESGSPCVQFDPQDSSEPSGSEDCLTLDIYAPRFEADAVPTGDARLPVMVWIHGGGNSIGSAEVYDAARLAAEGDVVVVAIQYRLGVLGWLSHPALRRDGASPEDASGNYGTLDTIRALEWVRDHIGSFGGDPQRVTVFGESAGGVNVFALLLSPRAKGLFHRAISQSGVLHTAPRVDAERYADEDPRQVGAREFLLRHVLADGLAADRGGAKAFIAAMSDAEIEAYLRGKTAAELLAVFAEEAPGQGGMYFVPNVIRDGHVIVDRDPEEAFATPGAHNAVPTIAGTNREETKLFALMSSPNVRRFAGVPMGLRDPAAFDLEGEYGGLLWKAQGVDQPLDALAAGGRTDLYGYRFDWDEEGSLLWLDLSELLGAAHAIDLLFVFGFTDLGHWTDNVYADVASAEQLSREMRAYWTHFAKTGAPGRGAGGTLPEWRPWTGDDRYLVFDTHTDGGLRMEEATVTVERVIEKLTQDPRITSVEQRCRILSALHEWSGDLDAQSYAGFQDGVCLAWPLELPALSGL